GHDRAAADHRAVHHHRADADEAVVLDRAAVHRRVVRDRAELADRSGVVVAHVHHHEVLHVRHAPDADLLAFGAHHHVVPERDAFRELDLSVHAGAVGQKCGLVDAQQLVQAPASKALRARARSASSHRKSSAVIASAFASSSAAASPISEAAQVANSALWIVQWSGAAASIGWIDGTRCETLPMSGLPWSPGGSLSIGAKTRPSRSALARKALASGSLKRRSR